MADADANRDSFRWQADFCEKGGILIVARICRALVASLDSATATGARILGWPGDPIADALPLRIIGGLHALHRSGRAPVLAPAFEGRELETDAIAAALGQAMRRFDDELLGWLDGPPQTNEAARSAVLMAGLLALAERFRPGLGEGAVRFDLLEIGSSAGLNLMIDRYAFDLGGVRAGPDAAAIRIAPEWRGPPPPAGPIEILSVRGVDISPVRVADPAQAERLMAYVWIDQQDRVTRTRQAIDLARADPPRLDQGDAADWVEARLAEPQPNNCVRVLMHSIVWQYLTPDGQTRIEAAMAAAGAAATPDRPLGWVRYEADRALMMHSLAIRAWPGDPETRTLATAHPHAAWIAWKA